MIKINDIKIPFNWVMIKPDMDFDTYQFDGEETGINVTTNASSSAQHFSIRGIVLGLPEKLIFTGNDIQYYRYNQANDQSGLHEISRLRDLSVLYDVPVELQLGDMAYFQYTHHYDANKMGRAIETDEGEVMLLKYDSLLFAHKENDLESLRTLNGHLIVQPVKKPVIVEDGIEMVVDQNGFYQPVMSDKDRYFKSKKQQLGVVKYPGARCLSYLDKPDIGADDLRPEKGEIVVYNPAYARSLEYDLHRAVFRDKKLFRIHRKDILAIFEFENEQEKNLMLSKTTEWLTLK